MDLRRAILIINGVEREVLCDPKQDSLATVVRRLGLTGTKVGCGVGQCGACSLLLDGKVVRACVRMMRSVKDYAKVETIEGLGNAQNLHPLQQAFLSYASIQCGFCSPGFIMSAKALLDSNPSPTRQDVRDWFTKNNNICRCTGYKPIVDAVMAAAEVLRGERKQEDMAFVIPESGRIYGSHVHKPKGLTRVLGTCDYGADVAEKMPHNTWHLAVVLAKRHHARILGIDSSKAEEMPGVGRVITAKDVRGTNRFTVPQGTVHSLCDGKDRPVIADDKVIRYGDVVAVVAARSREEARAAAEVVEVQYEELQSAVNFLEAVAPDAPQIHDKYPNIYMEQPLLKGEDPRKVINENHVVVDGAFSTTRQSHLPIEPDVMQAYPQGDGVAIQCKAQFLYGVIGMMAQAIGLETKDIRVINNPVGASFGYSMSPGNYALIAACCLAMNAPVSLVLSYSEHQHMTGKRAPVHVNASLACDKNGKMTAMDFLVGLDHGAYSEMAGPLTTKVIRFFGYPYAIENMRGLVRTAFTNGNFGTAYRAFGSPQSYTASESLVDMLAEKINMDPFEFRYLNIAKPGDLCTNSVPYREYPMQAIMDMARPKYEAAVARAKDASTDTVKRGVGLAWGGYHVSKLPDHAEIDLELNEDGSVTMFNTWADMGQGADYGSVVHTHEALRPLGLRLDQIHLIVNDTGICPDTGPSSGSRSHHVVGRATLLAAEQMLGAMRKDDGTYRTYAEMKEAGLPTKFRGDYNENWADIDPDTGHGYGAVAQNYVLYLVEVDVDITTGKTTVVSVDVTADIGTIGSYQAVLGQAWGGFSHSVGFALTENYDDMKKHETIRGAGVPRCNDVPDNFNVEFHITERENGPHGSSGCAEGFQSSGHVAVMNAIANATGVRITTLPASPDKVLAGLEAKAAGKPYEQERWNLGCNLYERLEQLQQEHAKK